MHSESDRHIVYCKAFLPSQRLPPREVLARELGSETCVVDIDQQQHIFEMLLMNARPVLPISNVGIRVPSRIYTIHSELLMPQRGFS